MHIDRSTHHGVNWQRCIDKACIDQNNIDRSLACLPVFLAGCQKLLIVAGPTYTRRLWCVMEIFTFLKMGGSLERIEIIPLTETEDKEQARMRLIEQFAMFDAAEAECFKVEDRQKLLAVIEASFGTAAPFNQLVREVLSARALGLKEVSRHKGRTGLTSTETDVVVV